MADNISATTVEIPNRWYIKNGREIKNEESELATLKESLTKNWSTI